MRETARQDVSSVAAVAWRAVKGEVRSTHALMRAACSVEGCGACFVDARNGSAPLGTMVIKASAQ